MLSVSPEKAMECTTNYSKSFKNDNENNSNGKKKQTPEEKIITTDKKKTMIRLSQYNCGWLWKKRNCYQCYVTK